MLDLLFSIILLLILLGQKAFAKSDSLLNERYLMGERLFLHLLSLTDPPLLLILRITRGAFFSRTICSCRTLLGQKCIVLTFLLPELIALFVALANFLSDLLVQFLTLCKQFWHVAHLGCALV